MSRRAPRPRNVPRIARILTVFVAAIAVTIGTVLPASAATSATTGTAVSVSRAVGDPAVSGIVKTSLAGFNAGNIISDAVFTSKSTMTEAQIQTFLNSKVKSCRSGYTCLKDLKTSSQTKAADKYCAGYTASSGETAARIIHRVAQSCGINPQVLIVMLQKEQALVTHTWPSDWRYNAAMGQACPDTAPCDVKFAGFFAQVYGAARQMQLYMEGRYFTWYAPGKTWNIKYDVEDSCGRSPVYIANKATSAMYYYTPYQPNAAALRAGYGSAEPCGAYGNRNFYNYFTDWFGSTQKPAPTAPPVAPPKLTSANTSAYVVSADTAGNVWGYPYAKGVWGASVKMASGLGALKSFFGVGDLNGDGHRDFIAVGTNGKPSALYGGGSTSLTAPKALGGDWSGVTAVVPAGDFTGDGVPDVFTTDSRGRLLLRAGDDRGGFRSPVSIGAGWSSMSQLIGGIDMNGDGKPDLIARDSAGGLFLYPGNGRGGWSGGKIQIGNGWKSMTAIFSPGDFTGNGSPDLLAHTADGRLMAFEGRGTAYPTSIGVVGTSWHKLATKGSAGAAVSKPRAFAAGVGNADGAAGNDIVAVTTGGEVRIYGGDGKGGWSGVKKVTGGWSPRDKVIAIGDFDGNGVRDLGRIDSAGVFWFYPGKSGGGYGDRKRIGQEWDKFVHVLGGIDFDGDRRTDILAVTSKGDMFLYRGDGKGGWASGVGARIGNGWNIADQIVHVGDFTGDGRADLMARFKDGTLRVYPTTGRGGFSAPVQIGVGWGSMARIVGPGDFDGDGRADVLGIHSNGTMYLYAGDGKGGWKTSKQIGTGWTTISSVG
ncbi:FG-GAP repeat domain-containing protein [Microbacterium sp. NPDC056234]|uniref:FG-GAP repeat domain-containing protein n=1 Tax=Microbacterium sp. NPDC056234 TaxID=3345757 RepID=UPI0035E31562